MNFAHKDGPLKYDLLWNFGSFVMLFPQSAVKLLAHLGETKKHLQQQQRNLFYLFFQVSFTPEAWCENV